MSCMQDKNEHDNWESHKEGLLQKRVGHGVCGKEVLMAYLYFAGLGDVTHR